MRYKGDYSPQYMLDPESYDWNLLDAELKKKLDGKPYVSLPREKIIGDTFVDSSSQVVETDEKVDQGFDSDDDPLLQNPHLPLFARGMPGVLTKDQLLTEVDLDHINLRIRGQEAQTCDLMSWEDGDVEDLASMKGIIGDLASAVGPQLAKEVIVSFGN